MASGINSMSLKKNCTKGKSPAQVLDGLGWRGLEGQAGMGWHGWAGLAGGGTCVFLHMKIIFPWKYQVFLEGKNWQIGGEKMREGVIMFCWIHN